MSTTESITQTATPGPRLPHVKLDPSLYSPKPHEVEFFKAQTGIQDDEELKRHIFKVQKEAWDVRCSFFVGL